MLKHFFRKNPRFKQLLQGPLRSVVQPTYLSIMDVQIKIEAWRDQDIQPLEQAGMSDVTALIKTFERPSETQRLIKSMQRMHPTLKILVIDDSRERHHYENAETVHIPFNSGLSAGRRIGLTHIQTPYFLLLDDDFVFYRHTKIADSLRLMNAHPEIDILAGEVIDLPEYQATDYQVSRLFHTDVQPVHPIGSSIGGVQVYDKVANFFLGRTQRVQLVNWEDPLKCVEHTDFFTRARGVLTTVFNPEMKVLHAKNRFNRNTPERQQNADESKRLIYLRYHQPKGKG